MFRANSAVNVTSGLQLLLMLLAFQLAQFLMLLRCFRPLRIFILVPHMRKVVHELCRGFKEIFLVAVLLIVLIFIFACYGVHLFGMRFAACNDYNITTRAECIGIYRTEVFVTKMNLPHREGCQKPGLYTPRVRGKLGMVTFVVNICPTTFASGMFIFVTDISLKAIGTCSIAKLMQY